jgi:NADPH-dependent ferric siderophore reductase
VKEPLVEVGIERRMPSLKSLLGKLLFPELRVTSAEVIGQRFRRLRLEGEALTKGSFTPGDKVQIVLDDGTRTYTPFAVDAGKGTMDLLVYAHGETPGACWGKSVRVDDTIRVFGPRGSIPLPSLAGPVVVFGDETSFALARAHQDVALGAPRPLFEVSDVADAEHALAALGLEADVVARQENERHLDALEDHLRARSGATLVLTGKAQSIQALRGRLRARPSSFAAQKVKAYWSVGKRGLD